MAETKAKIRVKLVTPLPELWRRQFPGGEPVWGECTFILDPEESRYDWLVVYNDLPAAYAEERLPSAHRNSLLVTTEPPSIKSYGLDFTRQFGTVLTSQPPWALPHRDRIYTQAGLHWFYGWGKNSFKGYDQILASTGAGKTESISTVCSSKRQRHTLHNRRFKLVRGLEKEIPELAVFGHGVRLMDDKAEALDPYRYHVAIENYQGLHHWTEKLSDAFLGLTLPFYFGCPNVGDYFPAESFIPIDLFDPAGTVETIRRALADQEYQRRLPAILEARRLVLERYNLFAVLAREIPARYTAAATAAVPERILSRHQLRREQPLVAVRDLLEKSRVRLMSLGRG